ncbi:MAG TPA: translation initiation factor IF-3 [Solirubrobacterales bacterium]
MPVPRRFDRRPPERDTTRINERIRVPQVRLIGAEGEQLGVVEITEALKRAQDADLDLVEVAPNSKPPVTRLLDYSKYKYEQEQKQKAARKHQQQVNVREIKLRPKIATHDYETKRGHVERFLNHHNKVKITIMFRGREQAHPERGRMLLKRLSDDLGELAVIESEPLQEGRNMSMLLGPGKAVDRVQSVDTEDESKLATDEITPPVDTAKPAEDESKPAMEEAKPPADETKAAEKETEASVDEAKPAEDKPKASKAKPKASKAKAKAPKAKPKASKDGPAKAAEEPGEDVAAASG